MTAVAPEVHAALTLADRHWRLAIGKHRKSRRRNELAARHQAKAMKLARRAERLMGRATG